MTKDDWNAEMIMLFPWLKAIDIRTSGLCRQVYREGIDGNEVEDGDGIDYESDTWKEVVRTAGELCTPIYTPHTDDTMAIIAVKKFLEIKVDDYDIDYLFKQMSTRPLLECEERIYEAEFFGNDVYKKRLYDWVIGNERRLENLCLGAFSYSAYTHGLVLESGIPELVNAYLNYDGLLVNSFEALLCRWKSIEIVTLEHDKNSQSKKNAVSNIFEQPHIDPLYDAKLMAYCASMKCMWGYDYDKHDDEPMYYISGTYVPYSDIECGRDIISWYDRILKTRGASAKLYESKMSAFLKELDFTALKSIDSIMENFYYSKPILDTVVERIINQIMPNYMLLPHILKSSSVYQEQFYASYHTTRPTSISAGYLHFCNMNEINAESGSSQRGSVLPIPLIWKHSSESYGILRNILETDSPLEIDNVASLRETLFMSTEYNTYGRLIDECSSYIKLHRAYEENYQTSIGYLYDTLLALVSNREAMIKCVGVPYLDYTALIDPKEVELKLKRDLLRLPGTILRLYPDGVDISKLQPQEYNSTEVICKMLDTMEIRGDKKWITFSLNGKPIEKVRWFINSHIIYPLGPLIVKSYCNFIKRMREVERTQPAAITFGFGKSSTSTGFGFRFGETPVDRPVSSGGFGFGESPVDRPVSSGGFGFGETPVDRPVTSGGFEWMHSTRNEYEYDQYEYARRRDDDAYLPKSFVENNYKTHVTGPIDTNFMSVVEEVIKYTDTSYKYSPRNEIFEHNFYTVIKSFWDRVFMMATIIGVEPTAFDGVGPVHIDPRGIFTGMIAYSGKVVGAVWKTVSNATDPLSDTLCYKYYIDGRTNLLKLRRIGRLADAPVIDIIVALYENANAVI